MKISIKSAIMISFTILISLVFIVQLIFNYFFATPYYFGYKCTSMENAYNEMKYAFDGTQESVSKIAYQYENEHNIDITISVNKEVLYSSHDRFFEEHYKGNIKDIARFEMPQIEFSTQPKAVILKDNLPNSANNSVINLAGLFEYGSDEITIMLTLPLASIESSVEVFSKSSLMISMIAILIGLVVALYLSRSISKPIKEMEKVAADVAQLDFSKNMEEDTMFLEFYHVSQSVNLMSRQLEKAIFELNKDIDRQKQVEELRREFVANVSHEMKTPLALLQLYAENLKTNISGIDKEYYCDTIIEESIKLSDMVTSMLDISSVESGLSEMKMEVFVFSDMINSCIQKMLPLLETYSINENIDENIYVYGDKKYLEQAAKNYITNAVEHTKNGDNIKIILKKIYDKVVFSVYNDGERIAEQELSRVWDSFYRSDQARVRTKNNIGLGLHIVKTIIDKHNGEYACKNLEHGVLFSFSIAVCEDCVTYSEDS